MPRRPPKAWFGRCTTEVQASGTAANPAAVCGAAWWHKSAAERAATIRVEEGATMAAKRAKKAKKHAKKHAKKAAKHHRGGAKRSSARHPKKKRAAHKRCQFCGHTAQHGSAGCLHHEGGRFCSCTHR